MFKSKYFHSVLLLAAGIQPGFAQDLGPAAQSESNVSEYFQMVTAAKSEQPEWPSPLISTNPLLEERLRFDTSYQSAGNGAHTILLDSSKGLDLIVSPTEEIQFGAVPYVIRTAPQTKNDVTGFNDWPVLRFKQRLASSPSDKDDYVVSAWIQLQDPVGVKRLTNNSWVLAPTLGAGKGWGDFDIQATTGASIPVTNESGIGAQILNNVVLQYHLSPVVWPEFEVNWTYFPDGPRGGENQVYLTPGVALGRFKLTDQLGATGYQAAVAPTYRASPLLPAYNSSWIVSTRLSF
jgi:hypothetical protein